MSKNIYISSTQRQNYTDTSSNSFRYTLNESMYGAYRLKAVSVPNTVYTIESNVNNALPVQTFAAPGPGPAIGPATVLVPNYYVSDGNTLATLLTTALNTAPSPFGPVAFVVAYNNYTSKLTFTANTNFTFDLSTNYFSSIASIIGFNKGIFSSTLVAPYTLTSSLIVNLTRTPTIFITISEFNNYLQNGTTGKMYTYMLPNNVSSLYFIDSFFDQTGVLNQFAKELNISLRDELDRLVDIQNVDWYMVLESIC